MPRAPTSPDEDARRRRGDRRTRAGARPHRRSRVRPAADRVPRRRPVERAGRPSRSSGTLDQLTDVALENEVDVVVLAIPRLDPTVFRDVAARAAAAGASVRYLPTFVAALERAVVGTDMRWLDVSLLLGRDEIHVVSPAAGAEITDRVVLVTGAGGSIGSELCRQVFGFGPRRLIMLDHDESNLHRLQLELWGEGTLENDDVVVADIRDRERIDQRVRPDAAGHRVPRGGPQAPAPVGEAPLRGGEVQRPGDRERPLGRAQARGRRSSSSSRPTRPPTRRRCSAPPSAWPRCWSRRSEAARRTSPRSGSATSWGAAAPCSRCSPSS